MKIVSVAGILGFSMRPNTKTMTTIQQHAGRVKRYMLLPRIWVSWKLEHPDIQLWDTLGEIRKVPFIPFDVNVVA